MALTQCWQHLGESTDCQSIEVTHYPASGEWQGPYMVCKPCRVDLRGLWRYAR